MNSGAHPLCHGAPYPPPIVCNQCSFRHVRAGLYRGRVLPAPLQKQLDRASYHLDIIIPNLDSGFYTSSSTDGSVRRGHNQSLCSCRLNSGRLLPVNPLPLPLLEGSAALSVELCCGGA